ncbi:hypothetical protein [Emticicia agri]|uniref:Uncharacterized protein n=1 Tax=Emticicia agri TaxID=2492393 RepID=A0A4Q5LZZ6_9BACT|nr:hypothetical protein [Emticicia agri]RYU95279.1 hypothetical protein EWM59_12570 [Emticicia agri]
MYRIFILLSFIIICWSCYKKEKTAESVANKLQESKEKKKTSKNLFSSIDSSQLASYIPKGYVLLDSALGDLNRDPYIDIVLVLKQPNEEETSDIIEHPTPRPLLLLLGQADNSYKVVTRNDKAVLCFSCGGMMSDPFVRVVIKKGYFSIEHYGGSAWRWGVTTTFKYNPLLSDWYLYKQGYESFHASDPEKIKTTIETEKDFGKIAFSTYDSDKFSEK